LAAGLAFDSERHRYVLFGGAGEPAADSTDTYTALGDTWETFDPLSAGLERAPVRSCAATCKRGDDTHETDR
jgi:hypothetical protein